jgi:hypothetical protein
MARNAGVYNKLALPGSTLTDASLEQPGAEVPTSNVDTKRKSTTMMSADDISSDRLRLRLATRGWATGHAQADL